MKKWIAAVIIGGMFLFAHQIFQREKRHNLILLGIFNLFVHDHAADHCACIVLHMGLTGLLVEMKVRGLCGDTLFPQSLIFLHWMSADIEPQHLLLKAEQKLLLAQQKLLHTS